MALRPDQLEDLRALVALCGGEPRAEAMNQLIATYHTAERLAVKLPRAVNLLERSAHQLRAHGRHGLADTINEFLGE